MRLRDVHRPQLAAVPDPEPEHPIFGALRWVHLLNGANKHRHDLERLEKDARRAGNAAYADHVSDSIRSLRLAEGRVRE